MAATYPPGPPPMTTTSTPVAMSPTTMSDHLHEEQVRLLEISHDAIQEAGGVSAVDDAVVEAQGQRQHAPHHDLPVADHRLLLDLVDAQDGHFGVVDDGRREDAAQGADV